MYYVLFLLGVGVSHHPISRHPLPHLVVPESADESGPNGEMSLMRCWPENHSKIEVLAFS
jgi:hypothetical protein